MPHHHVDVPRDTMVIIWIWGASRAYALSYGSDRARTQPLFCFERYVAPEGAEIRSGGRLTSSTA